MSDLVDLRVSEFARELASDSPAPGGGSAAALAGGLAAGLVGMVCRLSVGKEGLAAGEDELAAAIGTSEALRRRLLELVDEDTAAFNAIMDAIRLPKDDDAQRSARAAALAAAKLGAAAPPLETLAAARQTLELASTLAGRVNPNCESDLGVAVALAQAAAEGANLNVAVNVSTLPAGDDVERFRRESRAEIEAARAAAAAGTDVGARLGAA